MTMDQEKNAITSPLPHGPARDDDDGGHVTRHSTVARTAWASESLSLPREAFFVFVICMAQFCTRKSSRECCQCH